LIISLDFKGLYPRVSSPPALSTLALIIVVAAAATSPARLPRGSYKDR
jgi:hypothetical protein